jgi:serine/threonine-protein kinase
VLLYTVRKREFTWGDEELVAQTLATGERRVLTRDATDARYLPSGHLVFLRRGQLFAAPFDPERPEGLRAPVAVLDEVTQALTAGNSADLTGAGQFAISTTGDLAWVPGAVAAYPAATLINLDLRGQASPVKLLPPGWASVVRVSPAGDRLMIALRTVTEAGLWVYDRHRGTVTPLNRDGEATYPVWSSDGRRVFFKWLSGGRLSLAAQALDGSTPPRVLASGVFESSSASPDGRLLALVTGREIAMATVGTDAATVQSVTRTSATEGWPEFSPDGRWLAYVSDSTGRNEVYIRPHAGGGGAVVVSLDGGSSPAWRPDGRGIFFVGGLPPPGKRRMMTVDFTPGSPPRLGRPQSLFEFDSLSVRVLCMPVRCYDVARDGRSFYAVQAGMAPQLPVVTHINLVQNWFEELKAKVPSAK